MYPSIRNPRGLATGLTLLAGACMVGPVQAGAFDTVAMAQLNLTAISGSTAGLIFTVDAIQTGTDTDFADNADGAASQDNQDDPLGLGTGFNGLLSASTDGSGPAAGDATSQLNFEIENLTGGVVEVSYELIYSLDAGATGTDAYAETLIDLFVNGVVIAGADFLSELVVADPAAGGFDSPISNALSAFTLELSDGQTAVIDLVVNANGFATEAVVPAPPAIALLATGLGLLRLRHRRA
jgi:hypothetical protein